MKRIITLLVVISLVFSLALSLSSCDQKYNEEEVISAAKLLIEKSIVLNEIYWGAGILPSNPSSIALYSEANILDLSRLGFYTLDELKKKTEEVFTYSYCESIYSTSFSTVEDGEYIPFYPRYYQKYEDVEMTIPVSIMVHSKIENLIPDKVEYLYDTLSVSHADRDKVYVKIKAIVTRDEKSVQIQEKIIALKLEAAGWRIDSPTYLRYNDKKDEYEDLLENKNK